MSKKRLGSGSIFLTINNIFLIITALTCVFPIIHIAALSFSSNSAAAAGYVTFFPKEFTLNAYNYVAKRPDFWTAMVVSFKRIALGGAINLFLTILVSYPLSKEKSEFSARTIYVWIFFITMLFSGGLIPSYMVIKELGLLDSIWALVLPGALPVFNVILLLNFFRQVPKDLGEAAFLDGAGHWLALWRIYVPVSTPALATITLFTLIGHWNSWFDGLIYMNNPKNYPLQSYIQTVVIQKDYSMVTREEIEVLATLSDRTLKSAQIFLGSLPIIMVYPFLQKYFVKGIVLGGVKG